MTGFRVALGGAQQRYNITPDLTTLGKIIGGGLPVGAYGGKKEIMQHIAPAGSVYQAGTLSGNPLAMAAGMALLNVLKKRRRSMRPSNRAAHGWSGRSFDLPHKNIPVTVNRVGSMMTLFFTKNQIRNADDARTCSTQQFGEFFRLMLHEGIYLPPSQFEAAFISIAHTADDLERTITAAQQCLAKVFEG